MLPLVECDGLDPGRNTGRPASRRISSALPEIRDSSSRWHHRPSRPADTCTSTMAPPRSSIAVIVPGKTLRMLRLRPPDTKRNVTRTDRMRTRVPSVSTPAQPVRRRRIVSGQEAVHVLTDSGCLDQRAAFKAAGEAQIVAIEDFLGAGVQVTARPLSSPPRHRPAVTPRRSNG